MTPLETSGDGYVLIRSLDGSLARLQSEMIRPIPSIARIAEHLLAGKMVKAVTRVFLDWGGLNAVDAEATVLADVLRSKGIVGKLGSEGVLAKIANRISPAKGVSRLCPQ